jgi:hypothetical protein
MGTTPFNAGKVTYVDQNDRMKKVTYPADQKI